MTIEVRYVADDGATFVTREECLRHEAYLASLKTMERLLENYACRSDDGTFDVQYVDSDTFREFTSAVADTLDIPSELLVAALAASNSNSKADSTLLAWQTLCLRHRIGKPAPSYEYWRDNIMDERCAGWSADEKHRMYLDWKRDLPL